MTARNWSLTAGTALSLVLASCDNTPEPSPPQEAALCDVQSVGALPLGRRDNLTLGRSVEDLLGLPHINISRLPTPSTASGFTNTRLDASGGVSDTFLNEWLNIVAEASLAAVRREERRIIDLASLPELNGARTTIPLGGGRPRLSYMHGSPSLSFALDAPSGGEWQLYLEAAWWLGWEVEENIPDPSDLELVVNGKIVEKWTIEADYDSLRRYQAVSQLRKGVNEIEIVPHWKETQLTQAEWFSYALLLGDLVATKPLSEGGRTVQIATETVDCGPEGPGALRDCVVGPIERLARRAWRSPVSPEQLDPILSVIESAKASGAPIEEAIRYGVEAILLSPRFVFLQTPPSSDGLLDSFAMADLLSNALWRSVPDDTLLSCAESGGLTPASEGSCSIGDQVRRMLQAPGADALHADFVNQWLGLWRLDKAERDPTLYPHFGPETTRSMRMEARRIVMNILHDDRPVLDLIDAPDRWIDSELARIYDASPRGGPDELTPWHDPAGVRLGILTSAAFLAATSQANRTSPVHRGVALLTNVLCAPPGPPAPDTPLFVPDEHKVNPLDALDAHRADPTCAACHQAIDPMGVPLEIFDAEGRIRGEYANGDVINTSAELPNGTQILGPESLVQHLASHPDVESCIAQRLFTWLQGRSPRNADNELLKAMTNGGSPASFGFMIETWAQSPQARCQVRPVE